MDVIQSIGKLSDCDRDLSRKLSISPPRLKNTLTNSFFFAQLPRPMPTAKDSSRERVSMDLYTVYNQHLTNAREIALDTAYNETPKKLSSKF